MLDLKEKVIIGADMHKLSDQISVLAEALDQITGKLEVNWLLPRLEEVRGEDNKLRKKSGERGAV